MVMVVRYIGYFRYHVNCPPHCREKSLFSFLIFCSLTSGVELEATRNSPALSLRGTVFHDLEKRATIPCVILFFAIVLFGRIFSAGSFLKTLNSTLMSISQVSVMGALTSLISRWCPDSPIHATAANGCVASKSMTLDVGKILLGDGVKEEVGRSGCYGSESRG